ncbi:MAG: hypothetical protein ABEH64_12300 [Salinirussus sp.]
MELRVVGDRLETIGLVVGVILVIGAIGSIAGQPWQTNPDLAAVALQVLGSLLTIGLGVVLIWLARGA